MQREWYLITSGKMDEVMIVKTLARQAEDLAEDYLGHLNYEIYKLKDAHHALEIISPLLG
jgi:hypothetical protein